MESGKKRFVLNQDELENMEMKVEKNLQEYTFDHGIENTSFDVEGKPEMKTAELILYIDKSLRRFHQVAKNAFKLSENLQNLNIVKYGNLSTFDEAWSNKQFEVFSEFLYLYAKMMKNITKSETYTDSVLILHDGHTTSFLCFPLSIQQLDGNDKFRYIFIYIQTQCFPTIHCRKYIFLFWRQNRKVFANHFKQKSSSFSGKYGGTIEEELMEFLRLTDLFLNDMHTNFVTQRIWTKNFLIGYGYTIECEQAIDEIISIVCQWLGSVYCKNGINMIGIKKMSKHFENIQSSIKKIKESDFDSTYRTFVELANKQEEEKKQQQLKLDKLEEEKRRKRRLEYEKKSLDEAQKQDISSDEEDDMDEVQTPSPTILRKGQQKPPLKK